jgi:hypothetical protein
MPLLSLHWTVSFAPRIELSNAEDLTRCRQCAQVRHQGGVDEVAARTVVCLFVWPGIVRVPTAPLMDVVVVAWYDLTPNSHAATVS